MRKPAPVATSRTKSSTRSISGRQRRRIRPSHFVAEQVLEPSLSWLHRCPFECLTLLRYRHRSRHLFPRESIQAAVPHTPKWSSQEYLRAKGVCPEYESALRLSRPPTPSGSAAGRRRRMLRVTFRVAVRTRRNRQDEPGGREIAELAALADGSLAPARRAALEARVAASPELADRLAEQERAVALARSAAAEVEAPAALRARIEGQRRARRAPGAAPLRRGRRAP